ncbi:hypothetical protein DHBDCA_p2094 [Dehalobacter sp. DCA]|nr:hypothetical protein DHBDCA_p2094 [Dehalobacter sp. DCA]
MSSVKRSMDCAARLFVPWMAQQPKAVIHYGDEPEKVFMNRSTTL